MSTTYVTYVDSPLGRLQLRSDGAALTGLYMTSSKGQPSTDDAWVSDDAPFAGAVEQLSA